MVQKNTPYINKSGYSMFWNSMWDTKNSYSKFLQTDFFIKSYINFFFSDFLQNQFLLKLSINQKKLFLLRNDYNLNINELNEKKINDYLNITNNIDTYISKIWLFRYQNWLIIYFFIFSKFNSYIFKKDLNLYNNVNNSYWYNYINNYNNNLNITKHHEYIFFKKNNF